MNVMRELWDLTDAEAEEIRAGLNARRTPGAYEPGKWSVSHYNRKPAVVGEYPKSVILRDITLRTIEQTPVVSVTAKERLALARALVEAGVRSMQISLRAWSDAEESNLESNLVREMAPDLELSVTGINSREHIDQMAGSAITTLRFMNPSVPAITPIYYPEIMHLMWKGEDWRSKYPIKTVDDQIRQARELIDYGKQKGFKIGAGINMVSYVTDEYLEAYCTAAGEAGADYIDLMDGSSGLAPESVAHIVKSVKRHAPKVTVSVHLHNSFGLGTANCVAAAKAGAGMIEVSVNGLCSASGQADLAEVAASLEILYGVDTGIKLEKLTDLRRLVEDISGVKLSQHKAVTGEGAWAYSEQLVHMELPIEPLLHYCVNPEVFGNRKILVLGKIGTGPALYCKLHELGMAVDRGDVPAILAELKNQISVRKRGLSDEELLKMAADTLQRKQR